MAEKVFINSDNTATFICPQCLKPKIVSVAKYVQRDTPVKLKVTCSCGHKYSVFLDKRKKFRRQADLEGFYKYVKGPPEKPEAAYTGRLTVLDLSHNGLRVRLHDRPRFAVGDALTVEFTLNDKNRSLIQKNVVVRNVRDLSAGFEYMTQPSFDSVLGFYLFQ
jgi:hypothetical protein